MIGIYKITNKINNHCYIGQSRDIKERWSNHRSESSNQNSKAYEYPLYRSFRKYGIDNFTFEVLEECSIDKLNEKEIYWIEQYNPEYNQIAGGDYAPIPQKLTLKQVDEIQQILLNDPDGNVSHIELAKKYNVHKDTIRDINVGRTWFNDKYEYPLHLSKYDKRRSNGIKYCIDCGKELSDNRSIRCRACAAKERGSKKTVPLNQMKVTREELKELIRTTPFTTIGSRFGVTDNSIRKWCDKFNLPRTKKEINSYSDEEWQNL